MKLNMVMKGLGAVVASLILLYIVYLVAVLFWNSGPAVKLGVLTAAVSISTFIYNNSRQLTREIKSRHFSDKRIAYQKFFDFLFRIFAAQKTGEEIKESELIAMMHSLAKDLMIWGSAESINQFNMFLRDSAINEGDINHTFRNVENLMRSFRKDLGHDDRNLEYFGLSKVMIKPEDHHKLDNGTL